MFNRLRKNNVEPKGADSQKKSGRESEALTNDPLANLVTRPGFGAFYLLWTKRDLRQRNAIFLRAIIALSVAVVVSIGLNVILALAPTKVVYFATQQDGSLLPMVPLSRPIMSEAAMANFVTEHTTAAFTMSWSDYKADQARASQGFTGSGWESYETAIQRAHIIQLVTSEQLNMTSAVTSAPQLLDSGTMPNGARWWQYQFKMVWTYSAGTGSAYGTSTQNVVVNAVLMRVPQTDAPQGVLINDIVAREAN